MTATFGSASFLHAAPGISDQAIGGKLLEHAFQVDAVRALDIEGPRDLTPANIRRSRIE